MKGNETKLVEYMEGSKKRFVIPVYQRNYDWNTQNCKQLYDDLIKIIRDNRKSHFFGSIVSVYNPDGLKTEFLVIDGQQRLTTVSLLFLAMYNLLEKKVITSKSPILSQQIYEEYLVDKWQPKETRIKLKSVKNDQQAFGKLFDEESEYVNESNLTINYNYFFDRIQKAEISIEELYNAIIKLEIINITLHPDDNPQLIFESLNSTGLELSEGDKIRNFILMGLPNKQQEIFYEKYWNKIEVKTNYKMSLFIRDYLSVKQQAIPSFSKVYYTFKNYVEDSNIEIESLLFDMLEYAKLYYVLIGGKRSNKELNGCIYRLNRLETTVTRPFFLEVLKLQSDENLSLENVLQVFHITEDYLFRRTICDLPTGSLNKIFLLLHREIVRFDGISENYFEKLKYVLLSKKEKARFPDDNEFAESIMNKQIYRMNSKNKMYLLERFENYGTAETKDVWDHFNQGEYSIEHIMPQHLTPSWVKSLGEDSEIIHENWLHRIANLTITAYNSKYSNNSFLEKRDMQHGFKDSGIKMNQLIAKKDRWGLAELEERNEYMKNRALEIWAMPVSTFKPIKKQIESYSLDDDVNFSGRSIIKFSYKDIEQPVSSWVEMYQKVLQILHFEDKAVLLKLAYCNDEEVELAVHVNYNNSADIFTKSVEIDKNIFVWTNTSTQYKISLLRRFFALYNADPVDLLFYLKDDTATDEEEIEGTRYEIRRKYWTYALELIHKSNESNGCFNNVNMSKQNWISGFIGHSGITITCVANIDVARVELYIGKSNREKNKKIYDCLFKCKDEIEEDIGAKLEWNRKDDIKSSKIYIQLNDVSITNETDWLQMAKFHSDWSKKFYNSMHCYLDEIDKNCKNI